MSAGAPIEVRDLRPGEEGEAAAVLGRGMRDNPLHLAAYGPDADRRERIHTRVSSYVLERMSAQEPLVAVDDGAIVGVAGAMALGRCQPGIAEQVRMLPAIAGLGARTGLRVVRWTAEWSKHDPAEPHVHLGPVGVDRHLQGGGIGSALMAEHVRRLDEAGAPGYLETDKDVNVPFYERFGYEVVEDGDVIGVPNWYMRRQPRADATSPT